MPLPQSSELAISTLGPCRVPSPLREREHQFVDETSRVLVSADVRDLQSFLHSGELPPTFEPAGPRPSLFFDPATLTCGIVTCGGICPGLNNVIRSVVLTLTHSYGVRRVLGFRYGYAGLAEKSGYEPMHLTLEVVDTIHQQGGTLLGSSRGPQELDDMIATLRRHEVGILFAIGGDGTLRGDSALSQEIQRQNLPISVIGIPKTSMRFGLGPAARVFHRRRRSDEVIIAAHTEARGAWNGIGNKLGRHSSLLRRMRHWRTGCQLLWSAVPLRLEGEGGFLWQDADPSRHHAVIVVAEGPGGIARSR
jgi:6-phosphofructokinase 1